MMFKQVRNKKYSLIVWSFAVFTALSGYLYGKNQLRLAGLILGFVFMLTYGLRLQKVFRYIIKAPLEIKLLTLWVTWSVITGRIVAEDIAAYSAWVPRIIELIFVVWISYFVLIDYSDIMPAVIGILMGGVLQILWIVKYENLALIFSSSYLRLRGHTLNPNGLGFIMVWSSAAIFFLWQMVSKKVRLFVFLPLIIAFSIIILATGSRKSFLGFLILITLWWTYVKTGGANFFKKILLISFFSVILYIGWVKFGNYLLYNTPVGRRFMPIISGDERITEVEGRWDMYKIGFTLFLKHPIFGVGLNNYKLYEPGHHFSHSDYIEPLADTGLIGFLMYEAFYLLIILRAIRLLKFIKDSSVRYKIRVILMWILVIMFIGTGTPHFTHFDVFVALTAFSVYTEILKYRLKKHGEM